MMQSGPLINKSVTDKENDMYLQRAVTMTTLKIHLHGERITQDLLFHTRTHGMFTHVKNVKTSRIFVISGL